MSFIKALSLWQPWASLWLSPNKRHETRHWATTYRGPLLVHAAKRRIDDLNGTPLGDICDSEFGHHYGMDLPLGAIIGLVNLVAIVPTETLHRENLSEDDEIDRACGDFSDGRFAWRRGIYREFSNPIPYRGRQAMFSVPYAVVKDQIDAAAEQAA